MPSSFLARCCALSFSLFLIPAAAHAAAINPLPSVEKISNQVLKRFDVEDSSYDRASKCTGRSSKGALALEAFMTRRVRGSSWGTYRCEKWGKGSASLHAEGRALDWHLDYNNATDRRGGMRFIRWLWAADAAGNPQAMARRMGIQEIIWGCKYWSAGSEGWSRYSLCYNKRGKRIKNVNPTAAHIDHAHIGIDRKAARLKTSFWKHTPAHYR